MGKKIVISFPGGRGSEIPLLYFTAKHYEDLGYEKRFINHPALGEERTIIYPNGDICCGVGIVFKTKEYRGEIKNNTEEALEHSFFERENLPDNLNDADRQSPRVVDRNIEK